MYVCGSVCECGGGGGGVGDGCVTVRPSGLEVAG